MIKVMYFARLREQMGCDQVPVAWQESLQTLDDVRRHLIADDPAHADKLQANDLLVARNQEMAAWTDPVADGDEVALFPPVTGG